jgi:hypothetical protein
MKNLIRRADDWLQLRRGFFIWLANVGMCIIPVCLMIWLYREITWTGIIAALGYLLVGIGHQFQLDELEELRRKTEGR